MTNKLTPITPLTNGYQVVIVQEAKEDGTAGAFLGCLLQTPDYPDDGGLMLLGDAIREFKARTTEQAEMPRKVAPVES